MTVDITDYDEASKEIIKYMDYLPDDDNARIAYLNMYVAFLVNPVC